MKPSVRSSIGLGILYWLTQIASLLIVFPAFFIYGYVTKQPVDFEQAMPMLVTTMVSYVFLIAFLLYKGHLRTWSFYRWPGTYTIVLSLLALTGLIVVPQPELFFVNWYLSLRAVMSVDGWATAGILTFLIFLIGMGLYFFVSAIHLRKVGFYVAVVSVCLCLLSNLFAYQQKEIMQRHDKAIILVPSVTVRSTPSESGTGLFILHEGHKVSIKDDSMREWREIVIEDGKVGWVRLADIGII